MMMKVMTMMGDGDDDDENQAFAPGLMDHDSCSRRVSLFHGICV